MNGREVFKFATRVMVSSAEAMLDECGKTVDDVDVYVPHQANVRIIDHAARKLGFPSEKVVVNVDRYGNTSSGSIPLALADAADDGRLEPGKLVLMTGMGAGLTWGSALIEWTHYDDWSDAYEQDRLHVPRPGLVRAGHGPRRSPRPSPRRWPSTTPAARRPASTCGALCFSGSAEELMQTEVQQPALVATSLAINAALRARGIDPDYVVGHSVGEFAALGAAESIARQRGDRARARARARDGRGREGAPRLDGRDPRPRRRGRRGALPQDRERVAGELQLPRPARDLGRDRRGRRVLRRGAARGRAPRDPAAVSGAFHSPLVEHAAERLRPAIDRIDFKVPTAQFVSTVTAKLEDVEPLPLAARRAADGAGAVHAGRARADRAGRDDVRRGRARQRAQRFTEENRQLRAGDPGQRPGVARRRRPASLARA